METRSGKRKKEGFENFNKNAKNHVVESSKNGSARKDNSKKKDY